MDGEGGRWMGKVDGGWDRWKVNGEVDALKRSFVNFLLALKRSFVTFILALERLTDLECEGKEEG